MVREAGKEDLGGAEIAANVTFASMCNRCNIYSHV